MAIEKSVGIVLTKQDLREYDEIVSLLTSEYGLVQMVCRGSRRAKGRLRGLLEPGNRVEVVYYLKEGAELGNLNQLDLLDGRVALRNRLEAMAATMFLAEVTRYVFPLHDPHPVAFGALDEALVTLAGGVPSWSVTTWYLSVLVKEAGLEPGVETCVVCDGASGAPLTFISPEVGGMVCTACRSDTPRCSAVRSTTVELLRALQGDSGGPTLPLRWGAAQAIQAREAYLSFLVFHLDVRHRSYQFLAGVEQWDSAHG